MMLLNAELRRNIWLNFTYQRLILTPLIIGLIIYLSHTLSSNEITARSAFFLACFFIFLWGTKDASETVIEEINNSTWDFQRQSTISPWSMAWGKLIGSTLFSWYGAIICLLFYALFRSTSSVSLMREIFTLILGGIFSQALTLLLSLQALPFIHSKKNNKSFRYFFTGTITGIIVTFYSFYALDKEEIFWHGFSFPAKSFSIISLIIFIGWCLLGLQRSFCKELQYQKAPWVWALFCLFCLLYFSGFENFLSKATYLNPALKNLPYFIAFIVAVALTYIALFTDTLNTVRYKKFFLRLSEKNYRETLQQLPWWPISFLFAGLSGLFAIIALKGLNQNTLENLSLPIFISTTLLFMLRDILLAHFFYFSNNPKRTLGTILLYLFLAYYLIPLLLPALGLNNLEPMFLPSAGQNTPLALISLVVQIAVLGWLCRKRYHESWN